MPVTVNSWCFRGAARSADHRAGLRQVAELRLSRSRALPSASKCPVYAGMRQGACRAVLARLPQFLGNEACNPLIFPNPTPQKDRDYATIAGQWATHVGAKRIEVRSLRLGHAELVQLKLVLLSVPGALLAPHEHARRLRRADLQIKGTGRHCTRLSGAGSLGTRRFPRRNPPNLSRRAPNC